MDRERGRVRGGEFMSERVGEKGNLSVALLPGGGGLGDLSEGDAM